MKKIILTGGGTAGHVTPNLALLSKLTAAGFSVYYIGSEQGPERELATREGLEFFPVRTGKLRRYLSLKNLSDIFKVIGGVDDARRHLKSIKPDVVFSKGGFVGVPVVAAAKTLGIPVVIHESDLSPGLANKLSFPFAKKICCSFPETMSNLPKKKAVLTGAPIREGLFAGNSEQGLKLCGFSGSGKIILVMGGSSGSVKINTCLRSALKRLTDKGYSVVHLCGKGNLDANAPSHGYKQFEYLNSELPDVFACADLVVSRAGANSICELLALAKPNLLIPLSRSASRGDQIENAESFRKQGFSIVLPEEDMSVDTFINKIEETDRNAASLQEAMRRSKGTDGAGNVVKVIESVVK